MAECYLQFLSYILVGNRSGLRIQGLLIRDNILNDIFQGVVLAAPQRVQVCLCVCALCKALYFVGALLKF